MTAIVDTTTDTVEGRLLERIALDGPVQRTETVSTPSHSANHCTTKWAVERHHD